MKGKSHLIIFTLLLSVLVLNGNNCGYIFNANDIGMSDSLNRKEYTPHNSLMQNMDEGKLNVEVRDSSPGQQSEATVKVYSLDGMDELGPYIVQEGITLTVDIDNREWSVLVIEKTPGSEVSWQVE